MDANDVLWKLIAQARGYECAPVPALRRELTIAEHVGHQLGQSSLISSTPNRFCPGAKDKVYPGNDGATTVKEFLGIPAKTRGSVSMGRILWNSTISNCSPPLWIVFGEFDSGIVF